MNIPTAQVGSE